MSAQISVVIAYYREPGQCQSALRALDLVSGAGKVLDAIILCQDEPGAALKVADRFHPSNDRPHQLTMEELLPSQVLSIGAPGSRTGDAMAHFLDHGLDVNLLKEVGENLPPGGAALVILIEENWLTQLTGMLSGYSDLERFIMRPDGNPESAPLTTRNPQEGGRDDS